MPRGKGTKLDTTESNGNQVSKWERLGVRDDGYSLTWADCGAEDLLAALVAVTEDGAALLLSKTSDGGALSILVLTGTSKHRLYPSNVSELNAALDRLQEIAGLSL